MKKLTCEERRALILSYHLLRQFNEKRIQQGADHLTAVKNSIVIITMLLKDVASSDDV